MANSIDVIGVLRADLEHAYQQLDRCATYFEALDLVDRMRRDTSTTKANRTTQAIVRSRDRIASYLIQEEDDESVEDDGSVPR